MLFVYLPYRIQIHFYLILSYLNYGITRQLFGNIQLTLIVILLLLFYLEWGGGGGGGGVGGWGQDSLAHKLLTSNQSSKDTAVR